LICATIDHDIKGIGQQYHQHHQDCLRLHLRRTPIDHHQTCIYFPSAPHIRTVRG
jgi:hypothetical protein